MKLTLKYTPFIMAACCIIVTACSKMDDYKDFGGGKEVLYTGKPDSAIAYSGKSRIKLSWVRASDPKVIKTKIFWKNHTDSIEVPVTNTAPVTRRLSTIIPLPEGSYNFELYNYDKQGNRSVASRVSGSSYGDVYEKSLSNRLIESFYGKQFIVGFQPTINWFASEAKSVGVEVTYKDNLGAVRKVIADPASPATLIPDYDLTAPITYRTMFMPDSSAIDVFFAAPATKTVNTFPDNQIYIKNPGNPFKAAKVVGRWGTPSDWTVTTPVKNHDGPVGGLDNLNTSTQNMLSFEYWGTPAIINGKIFQTGTLPAGSYRLVVTTENVVNGLENSYISVAKGNTLPDVADVNTPAVNITNLKFTTSQSNKDLTLAFTLTQSELLSFGIVSIMTVKNESSLRIRSFKLFKD